MRWLTLLALLLLSVAVHPEPPKPASQAADPGNVLIPPDENAPTNGDSGETHVEVGPGESAVPVDGGASGSVTKKNEKDTTPGTAPKETTKKDPEATTKPTSPPGPKVTTPESSSTVTTPATEATEASVTPPPPLTEKPTSPTTESTETPTTTKASTTPEETTSTEQTKTSTEETSTPTTTEPPTTPTTTTTTTEATTTTRTTLLPPVPPRPTAPPPDPTTPSTTTTTTAAAADTDAMKGSNVAIYSIAGVLVFLAILVMILILVCRRMKKKKEQGKKPKKSVTKSRTPSTRNTTTDTSQQVLQPLVPKSKSSERPSGPGVGVRSGRQGQGAAPNGDPSGHAQQPQIKDLNETPEGLPDPATTPFIPGEEPFKIPAKNFKWKGPMRRRSRWHGPPDHEFEGKNKGVETVDKIWFDPNANYATEIGPNEIIEDGGPASDSNRSEWLNNLDEWERGHKALMEADKAKKEGKPEGGADSKNNSKKE